MFCGGLAIQTLHPGACSGAAERRCRSDLFALAASSGEVLVRVANKFSITIPFICPSTDADYKAVIAGPQAAFRD
ncbi:MAG: hypothetical protein H0U97_14870 [Gammaproteobacteria bacterium]|nr:hypothetical protein [Gammaproteobacteria bacterium]